MNASPVEFWHNAIGRYLDPASSPETSSSVYVPHRTLKCTQPLRLGCLDVFYIASPSGSQLIGRLDIPSTETLSIIPTESVSARKHIAHWLITQASAPFMCGNIGKANPLGSFAISHNLNRVSFCETGGSFTFDLEKIRKAVELFSPFEWKKDVAPAIHQFAKFQQATGLKREAEQAKFKKLFEKKPGLRTAILTAKILPNSGEYAMISWFNIEGKINE